MTHQPSQLDEQPADPAAPDSAELVVTDPYSRVTLRLVTDEEGGALLTLTSDDDLSRHQMGIELPNDVWQRLLDLAAPQARYVADEAAAQDQRIAEDRRAEEQRRASYALGIHQASHTPLKATIHMAYCSVLRQAEREEWINSTSFEQVERTFFRFQESAAQHARSRTKSPFAAKLTLCGRCKPLGGVRASYANTLLAQLPESEEPDLVIAEIINSLRSIQDAHDLEASDA